MLPRVCNHLPSCSIFYRVNTISDPTHKHRATTVLCTPNHRCAGEMQFHLQTQHSSAGVIVYRWLRPVVEGPYQFDANSAWTTGVSESRASDRRAPGQTESLNRIFRSGNLCGFLPGQNPVQGLADQLLDVQLLLLLLVGMKRFGNVWYTFFLRFDLLLLHYYYRARPRRPDTVRDFHSFDCWRRTIATTTLVAHTPECLDRAQGIFVVCSVHCVVCVSKCMCFLVH